ncbi:MAG: hypothetical protein U0165_06515 [Polyangiaceae bacterium]
MSRMFGGIQRSIFAAATTTMMLAWSQGAMAEESSASGKGTVGCALLGGEAVMSIEYLAGVQNPWIYAAGGVVGAAAGGVGGYYLEQDASKQVSLYLLAGGLSLVIPTTLVVLTGTSYHPPADYQEDAAPPGTQPSANPPRPAGAPTSEAEKPKPQRLSLRFHGELPSTAKAPVTSVLDVNAAGDLRLGVPAVELKPMYTRIEMSQFGVPQREEVRIPVFHASF